MWYTINATAVKKPVNSVDAIASCVESFIVSFHFCSLMKLTQHYSAIETQGSEITQIKL